MAKRTGAGTAVLAVGLGVAGFFLISKLPSVMHRFLSDVNTGPKPGDPVPNVTTAPVALANNVSPQIPTEPIAVGSPNPIIPQDLSKALQNIGVVVFGNG